MEADKKKYLSRLKDNLVNDTRLSMGRHCCVKDWRGKLSVIVAWVLFVHLYFTTVFYGIWDYHLLHSETHKLHYTTTDKVGASLNTVIFTLIYIMMFWSHVQCVMTNVGHLPRNYEKLEEDLPEHFLDLIKERESIYHELIVKRKMRNTAPNELEDELVRGASVKEVEGELKKEEIGDDIKVKQSQKTNGTVSTSYDGPSQGPQTHEERDDNILVETLGTLGTEDEHHNLTVVAEAASGNEESKLMEKSESSIGRSWKDRSSVADASLNSDLKDSVEEPPVSPPQTAAQAELIDIDDQQRENLYDRLLDSQKRTHSNLSLTVRRNTAVDRVIERKCYMCSSLQPPYTYHCNTCARCVAHMDHHCPWINNCVGYYTQKLFLLFLSYGFLCLFYASVLICYRFAHDLYWVDAVQEINYETSIVGATICVIMLGLLFVLVVLCDQIVIILHRLSVIDRIRLETKRLKGDLVKKRGLENYKETFGGDFAINWFLPFPIKKTVPVEQLYH